MNSNVGDLQAQPPSDRYEADLHSGGTVWPKDAATWPPPKSRFERGWADLLDGIERSWLWTALAIQDIKLRYRGSMIGPFWLTISTAVMIAAMGLLYARLFHIAVDAYLPYLALGLILWQFVSTTINEGCGTFLMVHGIIHQVPLPFSVHAYRIVYRNLLVLAHNAVIVPVVFVILGVTPTWRAVEALPGLAVLAINGVWVSILLGMMSARFRDVPPIIASFLQVVFFVTPIFWSPDSLGVWKGLGELNPLFAAIDVVRSPLLGASPAPYSWLILFVVTALGAGSTFAFFARFRSRIAFWV